LQVEYESSDPCVVAVGGTTLKLSAGGSVASEVGWSGGGGGKSMYFPRPSWQTGPGISGERRLVPDVALTADPEEGGFVFLNGQVQQFGGTSWSAPVWAGFCALINEARAKAGKPLLPFLNPLLYSIASECFRDVTTGSNGAYHCVSGYDLVTGLGAPNVKTLIQALA
jgi:kumamolisin